MFFNHGSSISLKSSIIALIFSLLCIGIIEDHRINKIEMYVGAVGTKASEKLSTALSGVISTLNLLPAFTLEDNNTETLNSLATELQQIYPSIDSIQIEPNGIIVQTLPLGSDLTSLGLNILNDLSIRQDAIIAKETKTAFMDEPHTLPNGELGVVVRKPIYTEAGSFWGFVAIVVKLTEILNAINIDSLKDSDIAYSLAKSHSKTTKVNQIVAGEFPLKGEPLNLNIDLPVNNWHWSLKVTPIDGWFSIKRIIIDSIMLCILFISAQLIFINRTRLKEALIEKENLQKESRNLDFQKTLVSISQTRFSSPERALTAILTTASEKLDVARISMWFYADNKTAIQCHLLIVDGKKEPNNLYLQEKDFPSYFKALENSGFICADNAHTHSSTKEFSQAYLTVLGINSMLDVPIRLDGETVGIVCCEHTGPERHWNVDEQDFVRSISDICANKLLEKQHAETEQKLYRMAHFDPLTGLANQSLFEEKFHLAQSKNKHKSQQLLICWLDLDDFNSFNKLYGEAFGDQLLIAIAERLSYSIASTDTVARITGDEFGLLIDAGAEGDSPEKIAQHLLETISETYDIDDRKVSISASLGMTLYPVDDSDIETLLRHAYHAMYQAKLNGKNSYHLFNPTSDQVTIERNRHLQELHNGLQQNEFSLFYQPKVNICTGEVLGVEALIRWLHPEKGIQPPMAFLPLIENSEIEDEFDVWVIQQALSQLNTWQAQGINLGMSINLSCNFILSEPFFASLSESLSKYPQLSPQKLEIEILESSEISDINKISQVVHDCQSRLGIKFALDDFGTGYSALSHLRNISVDTIKIDRTFVQNLLSNPNDLAIVESVIALAKTFQRSVVAEGIETIEQGLKLIEMGCEIGQGYMIAKPMPKEEFNDWLLKYEPLLEWKDVDFMQDNVA